MSGLFGSRLYVRIWLAVVAAVTVLTLVVGWLWQQALDEDRAEREARVTRTIIVRDGARDIIGQAPARAVSIPGEGWEFEVLMKDGQTLYVLLPRRSASPNNPGRRAPEWLQTPTGFAWLLGLVALAVALGAYPIVRRLTKRLEGLQRGVKRWGEGDLSARVPQDGQDEVADLATHFNEAAARVETLVRSHKSLLANASHELRSPLTRIRMALELMGENPSAVTRAEISRNIGELDQLIDEILLASRLDAREADMGTIENVELMGLAAEECARTDAELDVPEGTDTGALTVRGVPRLLRRAIRNLLENARRYGAGEIRLQLEAEGPQARLVVSDRGPGVPPALRERIFEPFYRLPGASEREGGVGLGLALVKSIAERHGGSVRCEERAGGGASFVITLPR